MDLAARLSAEKRGGSGDALRKAVAATQHFLLKRLRFPFGWALNPSRQTALQRQQRTAIHVRSPTQEETGAISGAAPKAEAAGCVPHTGAAEKWRQMQGSHAGPQVQRAWLAAVSWGSGRPKRYEPAACGGAS